VVISFLSGINLLMTGVMGLYVGRIHAEVKRRPLYVVENHVGFERAVASEARQAAPRPLDQRASVG
jgi:dolichol-phosphate mannosyltransferase